MNIHKTIKYFKHTFHCPVTVKPISALQTINADQYNVNLMGGFNPIKNEIIIFIRKSSSPKKLITVLLHEMGHLVHYNKNRLEFLNTDNFKKEIIAWEWAHENLKNIKPKFRPSRSTFHHTARIGLQSHASQYMHQIEIIKFLMK